MATTKTRRPAAKKRRPAARKTSIWQRMRTSLATHLGRQADEVWGLVLIVAGVLAGLGIYADLTGPAGRFVHRMANDAFGGARVLVPLILAGIGAALVRGRGRSEPGRVVIGCGFLLVSTAGLLDLADRKGGGLGTIAGEPMRHLLATGGAAVVLGTALLIGVLVLTRTSLGNAVDAVADGTKAAGRATKRAVVSLGTLGERDELDQATSRHPSAHLPPYDMAADADDEDDDEPEEEIDDDPPAPVVETHVPTAPVAAGEQMEIDLGPGARKGPWRLPPVQLLKRSKALEVDKRLVEAGGRTLEDALAAHGVETRLVGMTVGPTVTRYELELG
ncbi:MAG: DNA translocase FtsK 4TM domain-containing protein, partial [Actinobacteria bacterium]|nr:DNA translocase FtsK 4TM domain-containing protein [Actinomycetota bacterium]